MVQEKMVCDILRFAKHVLIILHGRKMMCIAPASGLNLPKVFGSRYLRRCFSLTVKNRMRKQAGKGSVWEVTSSEGKGAYRCFHSDGHLYVATRVPDADGRVTLMKLDQGTYSFD